MDTVSCLERSIASRLNFGDVCSASIDIRSRSLRSTSHKGSFPRRKHIRGFVLGPFTP
jgi:hypothetical protein